MTKEYGIEVIVSRLKIGMKQYELGFLARIHQSRMSMIESGRAEPRPDEVELIKKALEKGGGPT